MTARRGWMIMASALVLATSPAVAQTHDQAMPAPAAPAPLTLTDKDVFHAPGVDLLVFSNWYDGLFADSKISGVELIQRGVRTATNGDVRLSPTPGQWDAIGRLVERKVDRATGSIEALLEYPDYKFQYHIRAEPDGGSMKIAVILDQPLPAALAGKAGFNLEFLPSAYFHHGYMADGTAGVFPLHPASAMVAGGERNAASGRDIGPGAEPLAFAGGSRIVLSPEDAARRVTIASTGRIDLYDGRNQAQNGWFVARGLIPSGKTGRVLEWTITPASDASWVRPPVIAHSQLGYAPNQPKIAVIERDPAAASGGEARLIRIGDTGAEQVVLASQPAPWGNFLRYDYARFDFSKVTRPGLYAIDYAGIRTAPFRIAPGLYDQAWAPTLDVYMNVAMDHMFVNEAYRVWHGDPHRDDARQAPVDHDHLDLYAQGPTTDTKFAPGEHIPGLNVGGWLDAGDFDIRTQTQYAVVRSLVAAWEQFRPTRDTTLIDEKLRRVEMHVPDGTPDLQQQIAHGTIQLIAQFDAVGHAINGIVAPDVAQYTHLGDAGSKTDGLVYDPALAFGERKPETSGTPDDRWAFTSKSSSLNYGSIGALAAASRALKGMDDSLAARSIEIARRTWAEEQSRAPIIYQHGNTTGGPIEAERFIAAVEMLATTRDPAFAKAVAADWPWVADHFAYMVDPALQALPLMPASYRVGVEAAARKWSDDDKALAAANPFGVPIATGGWAGDGGVVDYGLSAYALHRAFPKIVGPDAVYRSLNYILGTHPGSDISFVSGVGTVSKEVAYGNNRADFSFIAGGIVPGVLILKPDFPENKEDWPFLWGENEYVINLGPDFIRLVEAANALSTADR